MDETRISELKTQRLPERQPYLGLPPQADRSWPRRDCDPA